MKEPQARDGLKGIQMIIAFAGTKGGVGKTTLTLATACELQRRGHRVLIVDADSRQGSALTFDAIAKEKGTSSPPVIGMGPALHKSLPDIAQDYDYVVIDCPGRDDGVQRGALVTADVALLPTGPNPTEVWAMEGVFDLIRQAQQARELAQIKPLHVGVVINKNNPRTVLGKNIKSVFESSVFPVLDTHLTNLMPFAEAPAAGQGVVEYAPAHKAAIEIKAFVAEILKKFGAKRMSTRPTKVKEVRYG